MFYERFLSEVLSSLSTLPFVRLGRDEVTSQEWETEKVLSAEGVIFKNTGWLASFDPMGLLQTSQWLPFALPFSRSEWVLWEVWAPNFEKWVLGSGPFFLVWASFWGQKHDSLDVRK